MLFTKETGIEEIINQIMFGFVKKKLNFVFYLQRYPDTFLLLCVVFPFAVCRLQQNIQTAQERCTVVAFELRARPKCSHVFKRSHCKLCICF